MPKKKNPWWVWLLPLPIVWWAALLAAGSWIPGKALFEQLPQFAAAMNHPFSLCWTGNSVRFLLLFSFRRRRGIRIAVVLVTLASGLLFSRAAFTSDVAGLFPPGSATGNAYLTLMASGFSRRITVEIDASGIGGIDGSGCAAVIESAAGELRNISGVEEVLLS